LFRFLCDAGRVDRDESYQAFNMGIGMVLLIAPEHVDAVTAHLERAGERALRIGQVVAGDGRVRWSDA
jgi:phosphoribosylformylglycinamidine cyclo-ligase